MKKLCVTFLLLPFCVILSMAQITESQPIYKSIKLAITSSSVLSDLMALGVAADHFHKIGDHHMELVLNEEELLLLEDNGINYEVLIPDMRAHYLAQLAENPTEEEMNCGLDHFDAGDMGGYHTYDNLVAHILGMKSEYGDIVELLELGTSVENRVIWGVKISDNPTVDESATEGVVHFDALHHAREPMSLESILYYMWWLLENYNTDPEATYLINQREMYFIPVVNPDGVVYNQLTDPNGGGFWRKNRRDAGNGCFGVDLNRNYSFGWGLEPGSSSDPCTNIYRGEMPFSEPETQAVRDLLMQTNPAIAFTMHTYGDVFLSPFGYTDSLAAYDIYAEFASEFIPETYEGYGTTAKMLGYTSSGTTRDFLHTVGTLAWTPEIGHEFWEPPSQICDRVQEFFIPMKYLSWVSGNYACFHDFKRNDNTPIWEGETISLNVRIKNRGLTHSANNVVVTLNSQHSALTPLVTTVNYGDIDKRAFQENTSSPFLFKVEEELTVGEQIAIDVLVTQDGAESYRDVIFLTAGQADILFEDDAETGMTNWTSSGVQMWDTTFMDAYSGKTAFADSRYGNYLESSEVMISNLTPFNLSDTENPWLEFNTKWSLEAEEDFVFLQFSPDNGNVWLSLKEYTYNSHWIQERIDLSSLSGFSNDLLFRFVLNSDGFLHSDGFYFDDFKIVDYSEPELISAHDLSKDPFRTNVFPNPGQHTFYVSINSDVPGFAQLTLTDVSGRTILEQQDQLSVGLNWIDLPDIDAGTYFLSIEALGHKKTIKVLRL